MAGVASRQKARLFLEGREIPFSRAVVSSGVGRTTTATISLVPLASIKKIKPRTQVHIFLRDTKNFPDDNYYLVFEGEVLGRAYGKRQDSRTMTLQATDYSSYWDRTKAYVMSPNFALGKIADVMSFQDAPIDQTVKALAGTTVRTSATGNTRIIEIMLAKGNKDLAQGVVNVINNLSKAGQFFAAAYERLRVTDRITVFTGGKVQAFLQDLQIDEFLADYQGKFGGISDLRTLLYSIMNLVFHDFISIPFPAQLPLASDKSQNTISQFYFVPDCYSTPPPMCNVVFPNQQIAYEFQEDFMATATRYSFRASMPLMTNQGITYPQFPNRFYPTAFSDYMFGKHTVSDAENTSMLGPSTLLTDPKSGNTFKDIFYGSPTSKAIGTSFMPTLREADYMSNEESLRGIFLDMDTFMPSYTALVRKASAAARTNFINNIGAYLFYKKRFSARSVVAEILFHPFLVPGFNAVFLDESEAGQSFIAKLESVTHVLQNDGCATQIQLSQGRDFDELDELTGGIGEPPVPAWFDPNIFGQVDTAGLFKKETAYLQKLGAIDSTEIGIRNAIKSPTVYPNLNKFYQTLFGVNSITNYNEQAGATGKGAPPLPQLVSIRGAVSWLLFQYQNVVDDDTARDAKVQSLVARPLVNILDAFKFVRAQPTGYNNNKNFVLPEEFVVFKGITTGALPGRFDGTGGGKDYADKGTIQLRRSVLDPYIQQLKTQRGFRG